MSGRLRSNKPPTPNNGYPKPNQVQEQNLALQIGWIIAALSNALPGALRHTIQLSLFVAPAEHPQPPQRSNQDSVANSTLNASHHHDPSKRISIETKNSACTHSTSFQNRDRSIFGKRTGHGMDMKRMTCNSHTLNNHSFQITDALPTISIDRFSLTTAQLDRPSPQYESAEQSLH